VNLKGIPAAGSYRQGVGSKSRAISKLLTRGEKMDQELDGYVDEIMEKQQYRNGIFSKFWSFSNLFDIIRGRTH
jgi:hypothetical protein